LRGERRESSRPERAGEGHQKRPVTDSRTWSSHQGVAKEKAERRLHVWEGYLRQGALEVQKKFALSSEELVEKKRPPSGNREKRLQRKRDLASKVDAEGGA